MSFQPSRLAVIIAAACLLGAWTDAAWADPPPWAQANGRRDHDEHGNYYRGYDGYRWQRDYGVSDGRCNTDQVLAVTGAIAGGVIGNRTSAPENRGIATILGAVIGGVVGDMIGDSIDAGDRACIGHSLELVPPGRLVTWRNPRTRVIYYVTPQRDLDGNCREFDLRRIRSGRDEHQVMRGCRTGAGEWRTEVLPDRRYDDRRYDERRNRDGDRDDDRRRDDSRRGDH
jgi:surface antigen